MDKIERQDLSRSSTRRALRIALTAIGCLAFFLIGFFVTRWIVTM